MLSVTLDRDMLTDRWRIRLYNAGRESYKSVMVAVNDVYGNSAIPDIEFRDVATKNVHVYMCPPQYEIKHDDYAWIRETNLATIEPTPFQKALAKTMPPLPWIPSSKEIRADQDPDFIFRESDLARPLSPAPKAPEARIACVECNAAILESKLKLTPKGKACTYCAMRIASQRPM